MKIGLITGVYIRENNISYDVVLWRDNVRSEINVNSFEVVPKSDDKLKIGFTNGGDS